MYTATVPIPLAGTYLASLQISRTSKSRWHRYKVDATETYFGHDMPSSPTLPKTMRAWTFSSRGLPRDVLTLESSYPVPKNPENDDLLIQVTHVSLNPGSYITMNTIPPLVRRVLSGSTTAIAEGEFSGVVHLAGPSAPAIFKPGTRVFGCQPMMKLIAGAGTLAEYFVVSASSVAVTPRGMDLAEASGLSGTGQTAINMFLEIKVKPGDRILVNGGSGGVGTMVVQMAKAKGAYVVATCSGSSTHLVKNLGADEVGTHMYTCALLKF